MIALDNELTAGFFFSGEQDEFWTSTNPNLNSVLIFLELSEDWTIDPPDMPALFLGLVDPMIYANHSEPFILDLIRILAMMPLRVAMSTLAWLDHNHSGLGQKCHTYARHMLENELTPDFDAERASLLIERTRLLARMTLFSSLFTSDWPQQ